MGRYDFFPNCMLQRRIYLGGRYIFSSYILFSPKSSFQHIQFRHGAGHIIPKVRSSSCQLSWILSVFMALPVDFSSEQSNLSSSRALHPSSSVPKLEVASWEAFICVVFQTFLVYLPWACFTAHHRIQLFSQCGGEQEGRLSLQTDVTQLFL